MIVLNPSSAFSTESIPNNTPPQSDLCIIYGETILRTTFSQPISLKYLPHSSAVLANSVFGAGTPIALKIALVS